MENKTQRKRIAVLTQGPNPVIMARGNLKRVV
jgi:hypothetical protein